MAKYTINNDLQGVEIVFNNKPDTDTLTTLKSNGFRWHRAKKLWYAKMTDERLKLAKSLATMSDTVSDTGNTAKSDRQTELKALYKDIIKRCWNSPRMVEHCIKNAQYIVELEGGDIAEIEKPTIETSFCFGFGYCGVSTQEDEQRASDMMHHAQTDQEYFINENLEQLNRRIKNLKDSRLKAYKHVQYCGDCDTRLKAVSLYDYFETPPSNLKDCHELTDNERQAMIEGYEIVKKQFTKRLETYLKRYGLSKLHTWTYLSD